MRNVPEDMQLLWCESGYYQVDPVQIYALESCAPFIWSYQRPDSSSLRNIIDERHYPVTHYMRDNNMPCGATVPLHLPRGGFVTVTGIHSGAGHERDIDQVLAELSLLAHTFQEQIYPLFDDRVLTCQHIRLSKRERECLAWAAEGLTAKEIARKLNRSIATVALHLNSAARKLGPAIAYRRWFAPCTTGCWTAKPIFLLAVSPLAAVYPEIIHDQQGKHHVRHQRRLCALS